MPSPPGQNATGIKRTFEAMLTTRYSKYGVAEGILTIEEKRNVVCSIICGGWPSWAMGAQTRGWHISRMIVKNFAWIDLMKACFPGVPILDYGEVDHWPAQNYSDNIWLSDGDIPRKLDIWNNVYLHTIITRCRIRHVPHSSWKMQKLELHHAQCGGVTTGT